MVAPGHPAVKDVDPVRAAAMAGKDRSTPLTSTPFSAERI
jgi:hypothetical protein